MNTTTEEHIGQAAKRVVDEVDPEAYAEHILRDAITESIKTVGVERTKEIIKEEAA